MNDAISRAAALDVVEKMYKMCEGNLSDYHDLLVACFTDLTPAQRWIPCSERLPSFDFADVLVRMHDVRHGCEDEYYVASAYVVRGHWEMTLNVDTSDLEIVAWCPMPEPYKEHDDD